MSGFLQAIQFRRRQTVTDLCKVDESPVFAAAALENQDGAHHLRQQRPGIDVHPAQEERRLLSGRTGQAQSALPIGDQAVVQVKLQRLFVPSPEERPRAEVGQRLDRKSVV